MNRAILVVDDDRHMVKTLCDLLRHRGWKPEGAHSGEEAVAKVRQGRYDAVLMDVRMSGIDGVEAFRSIRQAQPKLPVILMTAYSARELLAEAERLGVLRVLAKPFPLPTLIDLLEEAVAGSERILIVDDDADFLRSLSGLLQERGYQALQATDLPQAIAYLEHGAPGAVILDLKLDGAEPREAVLAIRTVSPAVMLILCSGHPSLLAETTAALPPGWYRAAITKPFDPELLLGILDELAHAS